MSTLNKVKGAIKRPFAFITAFAVLCLSAPVAYGNNYTMSDTEYWAYAWAEQQTGSDIWAEYQATNAGQSISEYMANKSNKTAGEAITAVVDNVADNMPDGSAKQAVYDMSYRAGQTFDNLITDPVKAATYQAAKATKTFYDNGVTYWSVAGQNWWDSFYNGLFNNGGYADQYIDQPNGSYTGTTTDGKSWSINGVQYGSYGLYDLSPQTVFSNPLYQQYNDNVGGFGYLLDITADGYHCYNYTFSDNNYNSAVSNVHIGNVAYGANKTTLVIQIIYTQWGHDRYDYLYFNVAGVGDVGTGGTSVLQPQSVGVIHLPNGDIIPIYTDPSLNGDYVIQPNGTVTKDNGDGTETTYPIYIDPSQLTPEGNLQILNFIINNPYSNYLPQNFNDTFSYDSQNGIFSGLGELLADLLGGLFGGLIDLLKAVLGVIVDLLSFNWLGSLNVQLFDFNPFSLIEQFFYKLLSVLGVSYD